MADQFDRAQEIEQRDRDINISEALKKQKVIAPTGLCLFCDEPIAPTATNLRFCDSFCRDDYDKRNK